MSRRIRIFEALLVFAVVASACGGDTAGTTTTAPAATTTSTSTTTMTVPSEVEIPETAILKLRPGTTYVASGFWEPVSFATDLDGWWWSQGTGGDGVWVYLEYHDRGESLFDLDVAVLAHAANAAVDGVVDSIISNEAVEVTAEAKATTVAKWEGVVVDIVVSGENSEQEEREFRGHSRSMAALQGLKLFVESDPTSGLGGSVTGTFGFGVRYGRAARIWVVDVDGSTIVIIAAAFNEEVFNELIPAAEDLIASIEFHP